MFQFVVFILTSKYHINVHPHLFTALERQQRSYYDCDDDENDHVLDEEFAQDADCESVCVNCHFGCVWS